MVLNTQASYPHGHTYVLKLHRDAAPQHGRVVGRLEHIDSGRQLAFESAAELIDCLARIAADDEAAGRVPAERGEAEGAATPSDEP